MFEMMKKKAIQKQPTEMFCEKSLRPATLTKKRLWHRCFSVNFVKFPRTHFLKNNYGRLLLAIRTQAVSSLSTDANLI